MTISRCCPRSVILSLIVAAVILLGAFDLFAQNMNQEGQTGIFFTTFAYTAPSPKNSIGKPVLAYHYLSAGEVIGDFHTVSFTVGLLDRAEIGYTRNFHKAGSTPGLSPLWKDGFNILHSKVNLVREDPSKHPWLPAISAGFVARLQDSNVSGAFVSPTKKYNNADFYLVATKTVMLKKIMPVMLTLGTKATNASLMGLSGNAPGYKARLFGSLVVGLKGPARSKLAVATEFLQNPKEIQNVPGVSIPTTIVYALRIIPLEKTKVNIDLGIAQTVGKVAPGVDLKARCRFGLGLAYAF